MADLPKLALDLLGANNNPLVLPSVLVAVGALFLVLFLRNRGSGVSSEPALKGPTTPIMLKLREVVKVTHNTNIYRFDLPKANQRLGLPIGKHFTTHAVIKGEEVSRPYTPTTSNDEIGYVDLLIKVYEKGVMSQHIHSLRPGQELEVRGPKGMLAYEGQGRVKVSGKGVRPFAHLNMVCGGTGITPMLQIIRAILKDPSDPTTVRLVFGNVSNEDLLLEDELASCAHDPRLTVFLTLDKPPEGWAQGKGYVTPDMMREHLFDPSKENTLNLLCGPPPMVEGGKASLAKLGAPSSHVFAF